MSIKTHYLQPYTIPVGQKDVCLIQKRYPVMGETTAAFKF